MNKFFYQFYFGKILLLLRDHFTAIKFYKPPLVSLQLENLNLNKQAWKPTNNPVMNCVDRHLLGVYQVRSIMNSLDMVC